MSPHAAVKNVDRPALAIGCAVKIADGLALGVNRENRLLARHKDDPLDSQLIRRAPFDPADGEP